MDEVVTAIKRFPRASARGGSGLTMTHVRELAETNEAHDEGGLLHALASLFKKWFKGQAPPRLADWIAGAPLTPPQIKHRRAPHSRRGDATTHSRFNIARSKSR